MSYFPYAIQLNHNQKQSLAKAYQNKQAISIRLKNNQLQGNNELMLTKTQLKKINKSIQNRTGMDLKISKTQIRKSIVRGGSLFTSLLSLGTKLLPLATKVATNVLPGLATGALSSLGSFTTDKILGSGPMNRPASFSGGFYHIPYKNLPQLTNVLNLLNKTQKQEYLKAIKQNGFGMNIKLTKIQSGRFLGTLLASIGIPLLLKAITGSGKTASGMQNRPSNFNLNPSPPFLGTWGKGLTQTKTKTKTKKNQKSKKGSGLILGKNSPFQNIPLLGAIL